MNSVAKKAGIVVLIISAFFALYFYGKFNPETTLFPKCPFYWATGLKCPGCGSQRALHHLLHVRIGTAFHYNACLVLFLPVLFFILVAELLQGKYPKLYSASHSTVFSWTITAAILLWWLLRNCLGF